MFKLKKEYVIIVFFFAFMLITPILTMADCGGVPCDIGENCNYDEDCYGTFKCLEEECSPFYVGMIKWGYHCPDGKQYRFLKGINVKIGAQEVILKDLQIEKVEIPNTPGKFLDNLLATFSINGEDVKLSKLKYFGYPISIQKAGLEIDVLTYSDNYKGLRYTRWFPGKDLYYVDVCIEVVEATPIISNELEKGGKQEKKDYSLFLLNGFLSLVCLGILFVVGFKMVKSIKKRKKEKPIKKIKETKEKIIPIKKLKIDTDGEYAVEVRNLSMDKGKKNILKNISFRIKNGDFCCIIGSSGGGKSSIIESIVGRKSFSGDIRVFGNKVTKEIESLIGFVPQQPELYLNQTVEQNLKNSCTKWGVPKEKINDILGKIHLSHRKDLMAKKLSGGQLKLLSLGMELIREPELLLLDEPTTGLDPESRNQIITTLTQISTRNKKTVIISTHYMDDADESDDVIMVKDGEIVIQGSPSKLIKMMPGSGKVISINLEQVSPELLSKINKIEGVKKVIKEGRNLKIITTDPNPIKLGNKINEVGGIVNETKSIKATMMEVFVYYIGKVPDE